MISSSIKVLQVNLNRSALATESALQVAIELRADLVVVQEPYIIQGDLPKSINHPSFVQVLPLNVLPQPRVLVYVSRTIKPVVSRAVNSPQDPDVLVIDIIEGNQKVQLFNIYNKDNQKGIGRNTLNKAIYPSRFSSNTVVLGDFNTYYPWWDPLGTMSQGAEDLVN